MHTPHCTENPSYVFPEMKLRGLVSSSYMHVSVSYVTRIGLPILQNVEMWNLEDRTLQFCFENNEAAQFHF